MLIEKFVRMEYLRDDLAEVFDHLKVPAEISKKILLRIPRFKDSGRLSTCLNVADYFSDRTLQVVNKRFSDWFEYGGYLKHNSVVNLEYWRQRLKYQ